LKCGDRFDTLFQKAKVKEKEMEKSEKRDRVEEQVAEI
jgi:hypothetical protein